MRTGIQYINTDGFLSSFLIDEHTLFREKNFVIGFPLRVFNLKGLWIDEEKFLHDLVPTFHGLSWDEYDVVRERVLYLSQCYPQEIPRLKKFMKVYFAGSVTRQEELLNLVANLSRHYRSGFENIQPFRRRAIARFMVEKEDKERWRIERVSAGGFSQNVSKVDYRKQVRVFKEMAEDVCNHKEFLTLLARLASIVEGIHRKPERLQIVVHQMGIVARHGRFGNNAPEGVHQDGVDYIVSALVVERKGIEGGTSHVYGSDKKQLYLDITLKPGEGIFQTDRGSPFWHDVTPISIKPGSPLELGARNIFGFDIIVE